MKSKCTLSITSLLIALSASQEITWGQTFLSGRPAQVLTSTSDGRLGRPDRNVWPQVSMQAEKDAGFVALFNGKDLTGWMYLGKTSPSPFSVKDGAIHYKAGGGWLCYTVKEYPDFELRCEFQLIKKGGDGGIFFRATNDSPGGGWPSKRYELQVKDYAEQGRLWGMPYKLDKEKVAASRKKLGEWETYRLLVVGERVEVYLNDVLINTSDGAKRREPGYIGLQAEGGEQAFRNLRVRAIVERRIQSKAEHTCWRARFDRSAHRGAAHEVSGVRPVQE